MSESKVQENKKRKSPVYKVSVDGFLAQVKDMDHKDLFAIRETISAELERRRSAAEKLVEELKGGAKG